MSIHASLDRVNSFLANLESLRSSGRTDAFINECIETGGTYTTPQCDAGAPRLFKIVLHDIYASGANEEEAERNWTNHARSKTGIEDDGFITVHPALSGPTASAQQ